MPRSSAEIAPKLRQYEVFLNEVLKPDLQRSSERRAKLQQEIEEYDDLEKNLAAIQQVSKGCMQGSMSCAWALAAGTSQMSWTAAHRNGRRNAQAPACCAWLGPLFPAQHRPGVLNSMTAACLSTPGHTHSSPATLSLPCCLCCRVAASP